MAFPYKTSANGGAAFVILYVLSVLLVGLVTMIAEIFIGKRSQANPVTSYKNIGKKFGWIGLLGILIPSVIAIYYSVLGGYTVKFTLNSFVGNAGNFDLILPAGENGRIFDPNGLGIVLISAAIIVICLIIYFTCFYKKETGTNEDEKIAVPED